MIYSIYQEAHKLHFLESLEINPNICLNETERKIVKGKKLSLPPGQLKLKSFQVMQFFQRLSSHH